MVTKLFFTQLLVMAVVIVLFLALIGFNVNHITKVEKTIKRLATAIIYLAVLLGVEVVIGTFYLIWTM